MHFLSHADIMWRIKTDNEMNEISIWSACECWWKIIIRIYFFLLLSWIKASYLLSSSLFIHKNYIFLFFFENWIYFSSAFGIFLIHVQKKIIPAEIFTFKVNQMRFINFLLLLFASIYLKCSHVAPSRCVRSDCERHSFMMLYNRKEIAP